ncbi:MAG TPA: TylF/MycF/NovP-related O-methyltransferase [Gemmatimonadaceae bacterium]|nr:MAG: macrocin O-methyltransferase [Acidobacteriota bacterium]HTD82315.1 TylF/MycF/NovP-related O-methyltransferase [Gemmatimonadaceae bacterium]
MNHNTDVELGAAQLHRARELASQGQWGEAQPLCEAAARSAPDLPGVFEFLGDLQFRLELWEPAARSYLAAIARAPHNAVLFRKLGDLQRLCHDHEGAAESYRREAELAHAPLPAGGTDAAASYLELMKDCLTFLLWRASDGPLLELNARRPLVSFARMLRKIGLWRRTPPISVREFGMDWPAQALTMIGKKRLDNIQTCVERVLQDQIPGDLIEAGVWRGGATIFMRAILRAYGDAKRKVWVADSFRGLPRPDSDKYPVDRGYDLSMWRSLAVSAEEVRENFRRFDLLDHQVVFLEGWFADTLPVAPIDHLAVLRLDGDLYESTMDGLVHLYSKLSPGGFAIVDDYYSAPPCRQAVDDFRRANAIQEDIVRIDWSGAFWRKQ